MALMCLHDEFLSYLDLERGCSPATIRAYRTDFRLFLRFLESIEISPDIGAVDKPVLRRYVAWLRGRGLKVSSVARRLHSVHSFWNYLRDNDYTEQDPFLGVRVPKPERPLPVFLSAEECKALLRAAEYQRSAFRAFRDKAVLAVLIYAALRRSELLGLRLEDVDLGRAVLRVVHGKGRKARAIPLADGATEALGDWLELRPHCRHDALFTSQSGEPMGKNGLVRAFRKAVQKAGIKKPGVSLHKLRHSFACMLLQNGCDLFSLSRLLGHTRLDTTAIYLHATVEDLRSACRAGVHAAAVCVI